MHLPYERITRDELEFGDVSFHQPSLETLQGENARKAESVYWKARPFATFILLNQSHHSGVRNRQLGKECAAHISIAGGKYNLT